MSSQNVASMLAVKISELLNRDYEELNGRYYIYLIEGDAETRIGVFEEDGKIFIENFLPKLPKEYVNYVVGLAGQEIHFDFEYRDGLPTLIFGSSQELVPKILAVLRKIYDVVLLEYPPQSLSLFGGFKIRFLGSVYSVVSSTDRLSGLFMDNYCTLPDAAGWYNSYLGDDNVYMPLFCWKYRDRVLAYVPDEKGVLSVFDVSDFASKLRELLKLTKSSMKIDDDADVFSRLQQIEEHLEIIGSALEGKTFPFSSIVFEHPDVERIKSLYDEVKKGIALIKKSISLSRFLEKKLLLRIILRLANKSIKGELGALSISTRKVSKLGAGYAVYISKEEARLVGLRDRITVKVVVEEGEKPKIVVQ